MKTFFLILLPLLILACAKPDQNNLEEVKGREVEVENENIRKKAQALEADLEKRQRFFSALQGEYVGTFKSGAKNFKAKMFFIPSLPPYEPGRVRTLDEITSDLTNLFFTIQIKLTNSDDIPVGGCLIKQVKPNYKDGQVNAAADDCSSIYIVNLYNSEGSRGDLSFEKPSVPGKSQEIAEKVLSKQISQVNEIFVVMQPTLTSASFLMVLKKVEKQ